MFGEQSFVTCCFHPFGQAGNGPYGVLSQLCRKESRLLIALDQFVE